MQSIPPVPRRPLGRTGLSIPVVPFGTQGFGGNFGSVSDEEAVALIQRAVALGVNHFDCARCYGDSLRKLGLALRVIPREEVIITGRVCCHSGERWGGYGEGRPDYSAERAIRDVEDQLERLGTAYFDGVLIHDPGEIEPTLASGGTLFLEQRQRLQGMRLGDGGLALQPRRVPDLQERPGDVTGVASSLAPPRQALLIAGAGGRVVTHLQQEMPLLHASVRSRVDRVRFREERPRLLGVA